ncbi:hypothetical protein GWP57_10160 [Gammaproteobacteria bacterium]|jgi:hypothetical protein|nr:hypothetical protein [Gammaproteobacteria bacterium]
MTDNDVDKDEEMICGLTADERAELQRSLAALPDTMPPRIVWERIREQGEAEGLLRRPGVQRRSGWYGGIGLAAAIVLAVMIVPMLNQTQPELRTEPPITEQSNQVQLTALQALMVQSQQLESDLRALPEEPRVVRASTAATLSGIEDRIAAIDYQLNDPGIRMTQEETELFWRERVRLMNSLVQLRYAQAQQAAY